MAKIPVSYQPNKIKKGSYTDWIDGGNFCNHTSPNGPLEAPTSGLNLLDAFDVDWSAYKLGGVSASATEIIKKLNEQPVLPTVPDKLIYYNTGTGFVADYLVLNDGTLVVDNDTDFALCTTKQDIETDILGAWQQFQCNSNNSSESTGNGQYNKTISPEYGQGVLGNVNGYDHPSSGYGWWYNDGNNIKNDINSGDFNGYLMPFSRDSYAFEMLMGDYETKTGVTTSGDQIGFSIVNDKHASPRRVVTTTGDVYYRNTLYDQLADDYVAGKTIRKPKKSAWVKEDIQGDSALIIFTDSPTSAGVKETAPSGNCVIYKASKIKTSVGRRSSVITSDEVTISQELAASGYLGFLTVVVTNSSGMELTQGNGTQRVENNTGTIYVFGSVFDLKSRQWNSVQIINGSTSATGDYHTLGKYLVQFNSNYDGNISGKSCIIRASADYNSGILKLKFGNPIDFPNKSQANFNGSELVLNFTTQSYDFEPYHTTDQSDLTDTQPTKPVVTNIKLPTFTPTVTTADGQSKTLTNNEFWNLFTTDTKFMYNAYSYEYLYIEVLNALLDNRVIYVKGLDNQEYGLDSTRQYYEYKGDLSTQDILKGSRLVYNPKTKKTFYSDGTKLFHIASVEVEQASVVPSTCNEKFLGFISDSSVFTVSDKNRTAGQYWIVASDFTPTFEGFDLKDRQADPLYTGDIVYVYEDYTSPIGSGSVFGSIHRVVRYSSYLPLSGTRDGLPLTGPINIGNCGSLVDSETAVLNVKLSEDDEASIFDATVPYVPLVGCTDSEGTHYYLMDICYFNEEVSKPMISFPNGICPGQGEKVNIGHATDKFNEVYASHFIVDPDSTDILLANGTTLSQSEITAGGDYLPLSGGTMSGNITFSESTGIVFNQRGTISEFGQNGLCLEADNAEVALEQGHIILNGDKVQANCNVEANAFFETSDIRKKEIKSDLSLEKCYDVIDKCQTIIYSLKDQTTEQLGMIAQEIEEFFPEVVQTDADGFKSLAYDRLVVICFKVLKDIIKRLEHLENGL